MSSLTAKKIPPTPRPDAVTRHARLPRKSDERKPSAAQSLLSLADVERAVDLGDGYVILQVRDRRAEKSAGKPLQDEPLALLDPSIPTISDDQVKILLKKFTAPTKPAATSSARKALLAENEAFMANLATEAMADRQKNVQAGLLLTSREFCQRLQITRQAVSKAIKEFRLFSLDGPSGTLLYPAFFANPAANRRDLERVSQALGDLPGPSKWQFFTTPKASLRGRTPIEALANGETDSVLVAAAGFRER